MEYDKTDSRSVATDDLTLSLMQEEAIQKGGFLRLPCE